MHIRNILIILHISVVTHHHLINRKHSLIHFYYNLYRIKLKKSLLYHYLKIHYIAIIQFLTIGLFHHKFIHIIFLILCHLFIELLIIVDENHLNLIRYSYYSKEKKMFINAN